jgi:hypothetical protein
MTQIQPENEDSAGLTTTGTIAIVIVVPPVILLAIAGFLLFKWRRKRRARGHPATTQQEQYKSNDPDYKTDMEPCHWELHQSQSAYGKRERTELAGFETREPTTVYELETPPPRRH